MFKNYLDFVNSKKLKTVFESHTTEDFNKYVSKVSDILAKHIEKLVPIVDYAETSVKDEKFISKQYVVIYDNNSYGAFQINWKDGALKSDAYSIDFFDNIDILFTGKGKSKLTIYTLGSSLVYFLPIIWTVVKSRNYSLSEKEAINLGRKVFDKDVKESYYIGALRYLIVEADQSVNQIRNQKYKELMQANAHRNDSDEAKKHYNELFAEYKAIVDAIRGGAKTMTDIKLAVERNIGVNILQSDTEKKQQKELEEHEDPEVTFKKMEGYIKMVTKGVNPSLIICGAPGVGKTYRVKKQLKAAGYVEGKNLLTIKGKCTPRVLYLALYNFKKKGDILVIDDADGLVGPKAPEESINILKGALDSTADAEGRLITYGIAGRLMDDDGNDIPKRFYYNGSVIIMTNYNAGSLDSALRGRSYIQDIHFSVEDILKLIHNLLPSLGEGKTSMKSKQRAYDYFVQLAEQKTDMLLSIRTFNICALLFESMGDEDEEIVMNMIKEQMKLLSDNERKKY